MYCLSFHLKSYVDSCLLLSDYVESHISQVFYFYSEIAGGISFLLPHLKKTV